ncbi:NAD(P)/FAD-dependent oxidoreductase [Stagnihabitans tardus]|uniref:FAD-dependent oxidoreductase n=1 Tax=Stagnihabitans tardus TaxID=2699202 RepID=A0AAE4Y7X2_9RHOB|nr:FAD-binding oxidoreductase [Stagnihabitans tardus]NBZ86486.1 FAD-dependent oxidoreductase [Stagnihabitans tardus]
MSNLWRATAEGFSAPPLASDATVDLAVIGGGFTGGAAALRAAEMGAKVCLLEAETTGHGGSGRNVGLANAGLWLPPETVIAQMGEGPGRRLIAALAAAPGRVFDLIARHGIDCEATRNGTLHLAHSARGFADLADRHRQGLAFGAPLQLLDKAETARRTGSSAFHGALFDPRAGTIQPLAYARGLARAAMAAGAMCHEASLVTALTRQGAEWLLTCNGHRIRAKAVLVATNAYHLGLQAYAPQYVAVSYCQFATAPLRAPDILPGREGCWDTALVMSSFRVDQAGRMILGAMGNSEGPLGPLHAAWARRKLARVFPQIAGAPFEHAWRGRIAMTSDHVPKILEFGPGAYACFGYSGRGIGPGTVFGTEAATALLTGEAGGLPLAPVTAHHETLTAPKAAWVEAGAGLIHAVSARG